MDESGVLDMGEDGIECICGKRIVVFFASCGWVNCPNCNERLKVGACD